MGELKAAALCAMLLPLLTLAGLGGCESPTFQVPQKSLSRGPSNSGDTSMGMMVPADLALGRGVRVAAKWSPLMRARNRSRTTGLGKTNSLGLTPVGLGQWFRLRQWGRQLGFVEYACLTIRDKGARSISDRHAPLVVHKASLGEQHAGANCDWGTQRCEQ